MQQEQGTDYPFWGDRSLVTSQDMSRLKTNLGGSEVRDTETIRRVTFHVIIHLFKPCIAHGDSQGPGCYIEDHLHMPFGNFGIQ